MRTSLARHALDFAEFFVIGAGTVGFAMMLAGIVAAFTGGAVAL